MPVSIAECRRMIGEPAESMTDADIEGILNDLRLAADALHEKMTDALASGAASYEEWRDVALMDSDVLPRWLNTDADEAKRDAVERLRWLSHLMDSGEGE
jgi:hypothetical protein